MSENRSRVWKAWKWLWAHANVQYVLPAAIACGLIAWIATIATARGSATALWTVVQQTWAIVLFLTFPYLAARALVWYRLMAQLGIRVPLGQAAVSFAGGEMTKSLPGGIYVENYILGRLVHFSSHSTIRSSMATTAMLGLETLIAVPIALIVGVPGEPWLFWLLLGIVILWVVILLVAHTVVHNLLPESKRDNRNRLHRAAAVVDEFLEAGAELLRPATLAECIPTALYMFVYVIDLFAILKALGVDNVTLVDTMSVYSLVVLAVVLVPIPTELGITELTGLGALAAFGVSESKAALAMLCLRLLATGATILVAGIIILILRHELRPVPVEESQSTSSA